MHVYSSLSETGSPSTSSVCCATLRVQFRDKVESIVGNPYGQHSNVTRLRGRESSFRLRFGDWRVVYVLDDERKVLLVAKIDRRGQVYR